MILNPDSKKTIERYFLRSVIVLRRDLIRAFRKKRPNADLDRIILHQDNATALRAASMQLEIDARLMDLTWLPWTSVLFRTSVASDGLGVFIQHLTFCERHRELYVELFQKWISIHRKCVNTDEDYVEKNNKELVL
ncbi:hypothetical protein MAR_017420 [Mya arenaria]|uniref:Uncharacterized protein n=1 Tax=Mya arenaria TaxID=6604 RepID=A0ABY7EBQ4_MYAAR|nr:hypothetical protein MAR_017420 [Mya arenaria]